MMTKTQDSSLHLVNRFLKELDKASGKLARWEVDRPVIPVEVDLRKKKLKQATHVISRWDGYAVRTKSSSVRHLSLQCHCGGTSRNNHNLTAATVKDQGRFLTTELSFHRQGIFSWRRRWEAGTKPKQFSEALRDNEGKLSLLPKDLDSLRMRTDSVKGRMTYLGGFLERGP
ncbi:hypothetical protein VTP01DRAFT_5082 [Rhizomucor pusillus]|uniref:uncharacterized protein n=1 Tax=Rhizomucor pusillus TaxID=4840 RepID=UPI00374433A5